MVYHVNCHVPDNFDLDRRIQGIGGFGWYLSVDEVIRYIANGHTFYVNVDGRQVRVVVRQHPTSRRYYIATEADNYPQNNLLSLPRCPGR